MKIRFYVLLLMIVALGGCLSQGPFELHTMIKDSEMTDRHLKSNDKEVFVTQTSFSPDSYEKISVINVSNGWYGSYNGVFRAMADRARELGADAVIDIDLWRQPSGLSFFAPFGTGKAVKFKHKSSSDLERVEGRWL